jgi:hypothetical protein
VRYEGPTGIIATLEYTDANLLFRSIFAGAKGCIFVPFLHPLDAGLVAGFSFRDHLLDSGKNNLAWYARTSVAEALAMTCLRDPDTGSQSAPE